MNVLNFNERSCERYRRYFDAYLDNELLVETSQDVLQHVTSCMDCNRILENRARIKQLVKEAITKDTAPPELAAALRERFRSERRSFFGIDTARWMMAAAAVLALAIGGLAFLDWRQAVQGHSEDGLFHTVSARVQNLLRVGLVDHVHCTILLARWKRALSFEEMKANTGRQALGAEFIDLVPAVQAKLGPDYKVVQGHRCTANRRQYVHLILTTDKGGILSLVITKKNSESFAEADAVAVMNASGTPLYRGRQGQIEVAGFESGQYLAYVVSNLDRDSNLNIASAIAPLVSDHLRRIKG